MGETWIFAEVTWERGVDSESLCLVKTHLRLFPEDEGGMS